MPKVTLTKNASITTRGYKFLRGVVREDVPYDTAVELSEDKRFTVHITAQEHQQAAFRSGGKPDSKQARLNMIAVAADELDPANPAHFRPDGKPDARALTSILGWQVTKDERDAAWQQKNAPKKVEVSPEAPKPSTKGDLAPGELKGGKAPKQLSKADRIIAKEEAREAARAKAARQTAKQTEGDLLDEDDDDFPPMEGEEPDTDGEEGDGGEASDTEEVTDVDTTTEDSDGSGEPIPPMSEEEEESTGGEDATGHDDSQASHANDKIRKGKLVLNKGKGQPQVDPTTAGAKEI